MTPDTTLRTIRIPRQLSKVIEAEADFQKVSVNKLVVQVLERYVQWGRTSRRFGYVSLASTSFLKFIDCIQNDKLVEMGKYLGSRVPKAVALHWFHKVNLSSLIEGIALVEKYRGICILDFHMIGQECSCLVRHDFGVKWTIFFKAYLEEAFWTSLAIKLNIDTTDNTLIVRLNTGREEHDVRSAIAKYSSSFSELR